jgi:hypothetical protein
MNSSSKAHLEKKGHSRISSWPRVFAVFSLNLVSVVRNKRKPEPSVLKLGPTLVHRQTQLALLVGTEGTSRRPVLLLAVFSPIKTLRQHTRASVFHILGGISTLSLHLRTH